MLPVRLDFKTIRGRTLLVANVWDELPRSLDDILVVSNLNRLLSFLMPHLLLTTVEALSQLRCQGIEFNALLSLEAKGAFC